MVPFTDRTLADGDRIQQFFGQMVGKDSSLLLTHLEAIMSQEQTPLRPKELLFPLAIDRTIKYLCAALEPANHGGV